MAERANAAPVTGALRVALLTNAIPPYRVDTLIEVGRLVREFTVFVTSKRIASGFEGSGVRVESVASLRLAAVRAHPSGCVEPCEMHLPFGLGRRLARLRPDVVVSVEFGARTALAVLHRLWDRRSALVIHADLSEETELGQGPARRLLRRMLLRFADRVLVNGAGGARYIDGLGYPRERVGLLPYATDVRRFGDGAIRTVTAGEVRFLYVGRLIGLKGLEPFLERLSSYLRVHGACRASLTLVGEGERAEAIRRLPLPENLSLGLAGEIPYERLPAIYSDAQVFVLPTLRDTWALVVNEAMASGLPVLGSLGSQAVEEMVEEGVSGWRFDPGSPSSVEGAIDRVFRTPPERLREMGARARARALELSPATVARMFVEECRLAAR